jgi:hypothetical protein
MIDFELVNSNIESLRRSLVLKNSVGVDWAYGLGQVFTDLFIDKVTAEFDTNTEWTTVDLQTTSDRKLIAWKQDSVIEEAHMIFEACTQQVSELFQKDMTFSSVNFWQDGPAYSIAPHTDITSGRISASIQIYIGESGASSGTELYSNGVIFYKFPWKQNTGYIMNTVPASVHGMMSPGYTRRSVYAIYN